MAKRFIDTGFLDQKWIRKLSPEKKIFLIYLMLFCDNGGIIELDMENAEFWIGKKIGSLDFLPEGYLIPLDEPDKYFIPKFINWQYNDLSSNKHIVVNARQILEKHNLINKDFTLNIPNVYIKLTKDLHKDYVTGNGNGNGNGKKGSIEGKLGIINFDFIDLKFKTLFEKWIEYKKERKESYKSQTSIKTCYNNLLKFSNNDPVIALQIIDNSIGNNYAGLFPLKQSFIPKEPERPISYSIKDDAI